MTDTIDECILGRHQPPTLHSDNATEHRSRLIILLEKQGLSRQQIAELVKQPAKAEKLKFIKKNRFGAHEAQTQAQVDQYFLNGLKLANMKPRNSDETMLQKMNREIVNPALAATIMQRYSPTQLQTAIISTTITAQLLILLSNNRILDPSSPTWYRQHLPQTLKKMAVIDGGIKTAECDTYFEIEDETNKLHHEIIKHLKEQSLETKQHHTDEINQLHEVDVEIADQLERLAAIADRELNNTNHNDSELNTETLTKTLLERRPSTENLQKAICYRHKNLSPKPKPKPKPEHTKKENQ